MFSQFGNLTLHRVSRGNEYCSGISANTYFLVLDVTLTWREGVGCLFMTQFQ